MEKVDGWIDQEMNSRKDRKLQREK